MSDTTNSRPSAALSALKPLWSPWTLVVALPALIAFVDPDQLGAVILFALNAFGGTLPFILFAVLLIAWLKATGAETLIGRAFEGHQTRAIFLAALFGGLAPFCSCEVIPFIAGLIAVGAPISAIMAFWLSSPLIDPPTLLITAAALGWPFAIGKAIAAVGLGLFGGFTVLALSRSGWLSNVARKQPEKSCGSCCGAPKPDRPVWRFWSESARIETFRKESWENLLFLVKWLALAYVLEALLVTYMPADMIAGVVGGDGVLPIVISAFVGMPAYLNSYVAPPLLAGLTEQGMSAGAAMSFMVAGAVSSVPAMAAVWALVKPRVFALYLGLGISGAILAGMAFQLVA